MSAADSSAVVERLRQLVAPAAHLTCDSRQVARGDVFLAYPGNKSDGRRFIPVAVERGAAAVVVEAAGWNPMAESTVPILEVEGLKRTAGTIAGLWYDCPAAALWSVGITGTSGKSSCALWVAEALAELGRRPIVVGTLGVGRYGQLDDHGLTTPDPVALQRTLKSLVDEGGDALSMEVSSIGLAEGRVNGLRFDVALFTNLTRDHLDYHGDMQRYEEAKLALFTWPGLAHAVINVDDPAGLRMAERARAAGVAVTRYSATGARAADLRASRVVLSGEGMQLEFCGGFGTRVFTTSFFGQHNVANLLGVLGVLLAFGASIDRVVAALAKLHPVPGRLERVPGEPGSPLVLIDYAHKPDALEKVLEACQPIVRARNGRLTVVFGCGGDRDAGKRPIMGAIAARFAQRVFVTSDNPRSEDPGAIVAAIVAGISVPAECELHQVIDRRQAIEEAIAGARAADVVIIAGKGHEAYQEIAGRKNPFSDVEEARLALVRRSEVTS